MVVTDRGRPVARLVGLENGGALEGRVAESVRSGMARRPTRPMDPGFLKEWRPSDPDGSSLETFLEERAEGW